MATRAEAQDAKERLKERVGALVGVLGIGLTKVGINWMLVVNVLPECDIETIPGFMDGVAIKIQHLKEMPHAH